MASFEFSLTRKVHRLSVIEMEGDVTVEAASEPEARQILLRAIKAGDIALEHGDDGLAVNWQDIDEDEIEETPIGDIAIDETEDVIRF